MRSRYKFDDVQGHLYFITCSVVGKIQIFTDSRYNDILVENFNFYRNKKGLKIFYYVIMDHHLHMIVSHPKDIGKIIQNLKSFTAKEIISTLKNDNRNDILNLLKMFKKSYKLDSTYQFWEEGNHPKLVHNTDMLLQKINYIHLTKAVISII